MRHPALQAYFPGKAMVVAEVGIPTSLGTAHISYPGKKRWHGHMTEREQANSLIDMLSHMLQTGMHSALAGCTGTCRQG